MLRRGERHHLTYRSAGGGHTTDNVALICSGCHADVHRHVLDLRGNADTGIEVWRLSEQDGWYLVRRELAPQRWERD